jgi:hypothetical protein
MPLESCTLNQRRKSITLSIKEMYRVAEFCARHREGSRSASCIVLSSEQLGKAGRSPADTSHRRRFDTSARETPFYNPY